MDLMQRRRALMAMQTGGLPGEYRAVKYLESTDGMQYIDTLLTLDENDFSIELEFEQTKATSAEQPIASIWVPNRNYWNLFIHNVMRTLDLFTSGHHYAQVDGVEVGIKNTASVSRTNSNIWALVLNGNQTTWSYTPGNVNYTTLKLFRRGDLNVGNKANVRLYSFKLYISGIMALNLFPCIRKSDSKPGMYDTVSKTFYTNAGTGEFIVPN